MPKQLPAPTSSTWWKEPNANKVMKDCPRKGSKAAFLSSREGTVRVGLLAHPSFLTDLSSQMGEATTASLRTGPGDPSLKSHWLGE